MISLNQVLLLEQKVESAVAKIAQLNSENAALREKCDALTNELSSKNEQLSAFKSDQDRIEAGILKALESLNSVENAVYGLTGAKNNEESAAENPEQQSEIQGEQSEQSEGNAESFDAQGEQTEQTEQNAEQNEEQSEEFDDHIFENVPESANNFEVVQSEGGAQPPQENASSNENPGTEENTPDQQGQDQANQGQFDIF